ncbi:MAG TPA: ROK family protein, partial [Xanthobacteraceae bacterium]|nr:ROK family protein [Xanthobacteraceae bacterium]
MTTTLVADIGGSKSRFALANSSGDLEHVLVIENDTVADLDAAVARYLEETGARPSAATLAVAGSVDGEEVVLTNRTGWRLRRGEFAERFGFSQLRVLNDFEAVAWALPHLGAAHTRPLGEPVAAREGVKVVLGPGTGLGVAALLPADGRWHVIASEGGHVSFGPQARDETAMFAKLGEECGAISAETVLSGPGLVRLARALDPRAGRHQPETIVASALAREPSAHAAARMFVRLLGRFAGGLALTFKALGGVYITGG